VATLALSDYYSVIPLNRLCGTLLGEVVSEKNINYLLDIAENYSCVTLEDACGNFLATNFGKMLEEEPEVILGMRLSTWVAMIKSDNLTIKYVTSFLFFVIFISHHNLIRNQVRAGGI